MTTRITVLGLGKTGISIGLALEDAKKGVLRTGFDEDKELKNLAKKTKAFDEYPSNITDAIKQADIIVLDLPVDRLRTVFITVAPTMKPNSILINMSPLVKASSKWAEELLPKNVHFISAIPAFSYESMEDVNKEPRNARADLFTKSMMFIAGDAKIRKEVIDVVVDFAVLLGATPYFTDLDEVEGLIANVILLPQLAAAALASSTMLQPGWDDNQRLAGNIFHLALKPLELVNETEDYGISILQNKQNILPILEKFIAVLQHIQRLVIDEDSEGLKDLLTDILLTRKEWLDKRKEGKWNYYLSSSIPLKQDALKRFSNFSS
ncbi:MAG: prephenate dehydrogenase/arogenate dehydrogenase family protein [Anaerolineaceae bacterium]|jgi:prephenate dehydrogenase|nr:MAG: prephenate dehydrogenase/arogenate dehydrogenase family protein [Anaerolineaceae bacterium]